MARPLRVTMFFDDGITGWSESHYDTTAPTLTAAVLAATTILVPARRKLLANGPWLKYIRASYDDTWRDSQVFFLPAPNIGAFGQYLNNLAWNTQSAAVEWTTVLLRGIGGDLYRKQIYISGIPFSDPTDVLSPQDDPTMVAAFQAYRSTLVNNIYGFSVWQRDIIQFPYKTITAVQPAVLPYGGINLTIPAHGFAAVPGNRLWCWNFRYLFQQIPVGVRTPNGAYSFAVVDPNTINVPAFRNPPTGIFVSGQAQQQVKGVVPYQDIAMERFTHRKRGRPFDAPRGRSRRRTSSAAVVK
jgi:hypothetical protein